MSMQSKADCTVNWMEKFIIYYGLKLSHLIFSATEQLSLSLQGKDTAIQEALLASKLALQNLQRQRSDEAFDLFYTMSLKRQKIWHQNLPWHDIVKNLEELMMVNLHTGLKVEKHFSDSSTLMHLMLFMGSWVVVSHKRLAYIPVAASIEKLLLEAANSTLSATCALPE